MEELCDLYVNDESLDDEKHALTILERDDFTLHELIRVCGKYLVSLNSAERARATLLVSFVIDVMVSKRIHALEGEELANRPLFWHYPHYGNQGGEPSSMIQENGWKLIHYWEDGRNELYNLASDINEQNNVADENIELTNQLYNKLDSWLAEVGANKPAKDLEYNETLAKKRQGYLKNTLLPQLEENRMKYLSKDFEPNANWWQSKVTAD